MEFEERNPFEAGNVAGIWIAVTASLNFTLFLRRIFSSIAMIYRESVILSVYAVFCIASLLRAVSRLAKCSLIFWTTCTFMHIYLQSCFYWITRRLLSPLLVIKLSSCFLYNRGECKYHWLLWLHVFRPILSFVSFQLAVEKLKLTYALLYCDNENGLAKRLLNINQLNRFKRALTFLLCNFFARVRKFDPICSMFSNVSKGETLVCMFMLMKFVS